MFENHTKISHLAKIVSVARKVRLFEEFSNTVDQKKGVPKSDEKEKVMHILVSCSHGRSKGFSECIVVRKTKKVFDCPFLMDQQILSGAKTARPSSGFLNPFPQ